MPAPNLPDPNNPANNGVSPTARPSVAPPATVGAMRPGDNVSLTIGENSGEPVEPTLPDETTWQKYAPNGEPVVGSLASFLMHGLMLLLILVGVAWLFGDSAPIEDDGGIEIGNGEEGGGGGSLQGVGDAPGNLTAPDVTQSTQKPDEMKTPDEEVKVHETAAKPDEFNSVFEEKMKEKKITGPMLKDALEGLAGKGKGGSGRGGGEGTGVGTGKGSGTGPGTGRNSFRGRRLLRWEMSFKTNDAADYLHQLSAIGAILAIPDKTGKIMVIHNINERPVKPVYEDWKSYDRIWWTDDVEETCQQMQDEMGLDFKPGAIVAFLPREFEEALASKERAFRGREEKDIKRTRFKISFSGGRAVIKVAEQDALPGHR